MMSNTDTIEKTKTSPWAFDDLETGNFKVEEKDIAGFNHTVDGFYRKLSADAGYVYRQYTVVTFRTAKALACFVERVGEMRGDLCAEELRGEEPVAYFEFPDYRAAIWEDRWPYSDLEAAIGRAGISCRLTIRHLFTIAFSGEQEARHFRSDLSANRVQFGDEKSTPPKFQLGSVAPGDLPRKRRFPSTS